MTPRKKVPVKDIMPISLTPCISKLAEEFIVYDQIKPAVCNNQNGVIPQLDTLYRWNNRLSEGVRLYTSHNTCKK